MNSNKKVAVAMSGGVDSSITALLLKEQGYQVIGVTGLMKNDDEVGQKAQKACEKLGIKHHILDLSEDFQKEIITYFEESYKNGRTPNPCVMCNKKIKWGKLLDYAIEELGADLYATGHYANIVEENGNYKITRAKDEQKDQLYMLFELSQKQLSKTLFPLGNLIKSEVKEIAQKYKIIKKEEKESQDICFIETPDTTKKYLSRIFKETEGNFIDIKTNRIIGKHKGYYQFTIGQRKGIGIAAQKPLYVVKIDAKNNNVYVGEKESLLQKELEIESINWQQQEFAQKEFEAMVKIRYNTKAKPAKIIPTEQGTKIVFKEKENSITPGQATVIFDKENTFLIGGGWIK